MELHTLADDGAPFERATRRRRAVLVRAPGNGRNGPGYAYCECGAVSPDAHLTSAARIEWWRRHLVHVGARPTTSPAPGDPEPDTTSPAHDPVWDAPRTIPA